MAGAKKIRNHGSSQKNTRLRITDVQYSYRQISSLILPADYSTSNPDLQITLILTCSMLIQSPFICRLNPFLLADDIYSYLQNTFILTCRLHSFLPTDYIHSYLQITFILTCRLHTFLPIDDIHLFLQITSILICRIYSFLSAD